MSGERVFLDTNVIVYAYDETAGRKHDIARDLLIGLWNAGGGLVSTQVLQEFYVTVTKKLPSPLPKLEARQIVEDFLTWEVVTNDGESILAAVDLQSAQKLSFWDALIVVSAQKAAADVLLSEDFSDGRRFEGLLIRNPFGGD